MLSLARSSCNLPQKLVKNYDLIAVEDLKIKELARTRLSKSILDAAWGQFITILETVAVKCGVRVVRVSPYSTPQDCSNCGAKVPKTLSIRLHECHKCGLQMDRDENAARNILDRALNGSSPCRGNFRTLKPLLYLEYSNLYLEMA